MAISYGTAATNTADNTTSLTITKPGDVVDGTLLFAFIVSDPRTMDSVPTNWQLLEYRSDGVPFARTYTYWKWVETAASEPASYTWGTSLNSYWDGGILPVFGASNPADNAIEIVTNSGGYDDSPICLSVTPSDADSLVIGCVGTSLARTSTPPGGYAELFDLSSGSSSATIAAAILGATPTGNKTFTLSSGNNWATQHLAIAPAAGSSFNPAWAARSNKLIGGGVA